MARIFFLLLLPCLVFAHIDQVFPENEDPTIFHHVNVISGNLTLSLVDTLVQGAQPIPIQRSYSSGGALEQTSQNIDRILRTVRNGWMVQGGWTLFPHTNLLLETAHQKRDIKIYIPEPNGNMIAYAYSHKKSKHTLYFKPIHPVSQTSKISYRTNPQNNLLQINLKTGIATLFLPDGGERIYKGPGFFEEGSSTFGKTFYLLEREKLASGHQLRYFYDQKPSHLKRIESTNPAGDKVYASIDIDYIPPEKHKPYELKFNTSDGKWLHYKTYAHESRAYINQLESNCSPPGWFHFVPGRKGIGARLSSIDLAGKEPFSVRYYLPLNKDQEKKWAEKHEQKEYHIDKVEKIIAPVSPDGEKAALAHFLYEPNLTSVRDAEGLLIRYHHDGERLHLIEYFDDKEKIHSRLKFYWQEGKLRCKAMFDANSEALFAKTFVYDGDDVIEETLFGTLTGNPAAPLHIDEQGRCEGKESYRKTYSYYQDAFHLLKTESEEQGLTYEYFYKPGTDLCRAQFTKDPQGTILIREFSLYNEDHLLVSEIIDDGFSFDSADLRGVTERLEKRYERNPNSGLIESISEFYLDIDTQTVKQLKKVKYGYLNGKIDQEEVFDALGSSRYTLFTEYDDFGFVKKKTTPLGKENTYRYDRSGLLEESKEVGSFKKIFVYNLANRLHSCQEPDTKKIIATTYDVKGRILSQTDGRGNLICHSYDCFGNQKTTKLPCCLNEKEQIAHPILNFDYDVNGNLIFAEMPCQETTLTTYNLFKKPLLKTQADGTELLHFYNKNGTLAKIVFPDGTEESYQYDLFQREISKVISSNGRILSSETWEYNAFQLLSHTDTRGLKTRFFYDGAGRKIKEEAEGRTIAFTYDPLGFLEKTDNGVVALVQKHNVEGLIEEQWEEDATGRIENWMQFSYDEENRKEKAIRKTSQGESVDRFTYTNGKLSSHTDPLGSITTFVSNEFFQNELGQNVLQKTTTDPLGQSTVETYDAGERIVLREKTNSQGQAVFKERFFYDLSGNLTKHTSYIYANGAPIKEVTITRNYDAMGRVKEEIESGQKRTVFEYDVRGRLASKTLPDGTSLFYRYDGAHRLEELTSDGLIHYHYSYEIGPDPIQIKDLVQGITLTREYNRFGQIISEVNGNGDLSRWEYDAIGRCTLFTLPDGSSIAYPTQGMHIKAVQRKDSNGHVLYEHRYHKFDCNGHVFLEEPIFNLSPIQTTHDLLERPCSLISSQMEHSISYGPSGLVTKTSNSLFGEKPYQYDALNQLEKEGDESYAFDSLGNPSEYEVNLLNQICSTPDCTLTYDENGNPQKKITAEGTTTYRFDPLGRLTEIIQQQRKVHYTYDPLSRLFAKETFVYTESDSRIGICQGGAPNLSQAQPVEAPNLNSFSDADRIKDGGKPMPTEPILESRAVYRSNSWEKEKKMFYLYDQDQEIGTQDETGSLLELKVLGLGLRGDIGAAVAIEIKDAVYAPLHDFNGNIIAIVSPDGTIAEKYEMNAFGKETASSPVNPWRFSSKRSEEGLYFFGLRFYDPALGRWLSPDPAGFSDGINLYAFVQNSPLNRLDLFGLSSEDAFGRVDIRMPIPIIPRFPYFDFFLAKGSIQGVEVDFAVCCGHWHQLQFTPAEMKAGEINLMNHLHELVPSQGQYIGLVGVGNGIYTSRREFLDMAAAVGETAKGALSISLYNPTGLSSFGYGLGCGIDLERVRLEREGIETPIVCLQRQFMSTMGARLHEINPQLFWLFLPHSENGLITRMSIERMDADPRKILQKILLIHASGPAEPIPKSCGASVLNVYSKQDYVTGFGPLGHASPYINNPDYHIKILHCISSLSDKNARIADHGFLKPTYRNEWKDHIGYLHKTIKFYQGSSDAKNR